MRGGWQKIRHLRNKKPRQSQHCRSRFSAPKAAVLRTCRASTHNPFSAVILTLRLFSCRTAFSGNIPMTGFRHVRPPPRLQWRYRPGFAPGSLFSSGISATSEELRWLFTFGKTIAHFWFPVNQEKRYISLSLPLFSAFLSVQASRTFRK